MSAGPTAVPRFANLDSRPRLGLIHQGRTGHESPAEGRIAKMNDKAKKVSKLRMGAGVALATVGLSLAGSLAPAIASADPWVPFSGPFHPVRHYAADVLHPVWALTHPVRASIP